METSYDSINSKDKNVKKVIEGTAKVKKKGPFARIKDIIIEGDVDKAKDYAVEGILIPSIKKVLRDMLVSTIDILFTGDTRRSRSSSGSRISYNDYYDRDRGDADRFYRSTRSIYSLNDVTFDNIVDAERVLDRMEELMSHFKIVSVADFYELAGVPGEYTDNKYGWTSLESARIVSNGRGFYISLPRPMQIS